MTARTSRSTAEFHVNQATVPLGVAVFDCACGATKVQYGFERPSGWSTGDDGADRCPHCVSQAQPGTPDDADRV